MKSVELLRIRKWTNVQIPISSLGNRQKMCSLHQYASLKTSRDCLNTHHKTQPWGSLPTKLTFSHVFLQCHLIKTHLTPLPYVWHRQMAGPRLVTDPHIRVLNFDPLPSTVHSIACSTVKALYFKQWLVRNRTRCLRTQAGISKIFTETLLKDC